MSGWQSRGALLGAVGAGELVKAEVEFSDVVAFCDSEYDVVAGWMVVWPVIVTVMDET